LNKNKIIMETPSRKSQQDKSCEDFDELPLQQKLQFMSSLLTSLKKGSSDEQVQSYDSSEDCCSHCPQCLAQKNTLAKESLSQGSSPPSQDSLEDGGKKKKVFFPSKNGERYPKEIKIEAIQIACKDNNNNEAVRQIKEKYRDQNLYQSLSEKSVRKWRADKELNHQFEYDQSHLQRRQIRKITSPYQEQERQLIDVIKARRQNNERVTRDWIMSEALNTFNDSHFSASNGWFERFKRRWRLSRRVATHVIQKLSVNYAELSLEYLEELRRSKYDYEMKEKLEVLYGNMDEVSLRFNMSDKTTYDFTGSKEISLKTCQGLTLTFTALLTVLSDGTKLPPLLVFKSKNAIPKKVQQKFAEKILLFSNASGWCNSSIMVDWINKLWLNLNIKSKQKLFLILDQFSAHKKPEIQSLLKEGGSEVRYIPPGLTGLLQPLDTHINRSFKARMRHLFDRWYDDHGVKDANKTPKGYLKAPSVEIIITWVLEAWNSVPEELIRRAFPHCGINLDRSNVGNFNPKLSKKESICAYLETAYRQPTIDPHDDRFEVSNEIDKDPNGVNYDVGDDKEMIPLQSDQEEMAVMEDKREDDEEMDDYVDAEFQIMNDEINEIQYEKEPEKPTMFKAPFWIEQVLKLEGTLKKPKLMPKDKVPTKQGKLEGFIKK